MWGTVGRMGYRALQGTYECRLDDRFRFAIPAKLRASFENGCVIAWWFDDCLIVAPPDVWGTMLETNFGTTSVLNDPSRELLRFFRAGADEQMLDKQGRILVPAHARAHAGLEGTVNVVGAGDYIEVWNPEKLAARFEALRTKGVSQYAKELLAGNA